MIKFSPINAIWNSKIWFLERNPIDPTGHVQGIVAHDGEDIKGMLVFDTWTENSCQVHIVIEDPMIIRHGFLKEGFKYVFEDAGRGIIYGITPADNEKAIKFNKHVGFVEVYRLKDAHVVGVDLIIQEVRRENYYGQESSLAA